MRATYSLICLLMCTFLYGQKDSLILNAKELGAKDVNITTDILNRQKVVSASRSLQDVNELPITIYVVTKEEIYKNGYTTLVDVLKTVPGIRVSQPGSALEGETFTMRGLIGNAYAKILINDIPIKPFNVLGMPLAAQLPIRQAERIEIIFGPGTTVYGADASAGVINIITNQSERPVFTQADLSLGSQGYSSLNLLFGGKLGKDKRILNYTVFAGTTTGTDRNIKYDDDLFNPKNYQFTQPINNVQQNPNYTGSDSLATINDLPYLSRSLGVLLKYRSLNLSYMRMERRDHSAIGTNPLAVSYASPLNYFGEKITNYHVDIKKDFKKIGFKTSLNVLTSFVDNNSSFTHVENTLKNAFDIAAFREAGTDVELYRSYQDTIFSRFFSGTRYAYASSLDGRFEQLVNLQPRRNIELVLGGHVQASTGVPYSNYLRNPQEKVLLTSTQGLNDFADAYTGYDYGVFTQMYWTLKRWNMIFGLQYFNYFSAEKVQIDLTRNLNPRFAVLYKINKLMSARASYATAFKVPTPFYNANSFTVDIESFDIFSAERSTRNLQPENTNYGELGYRFDNDKVNIDVSFFYTKTSNLISYDFKNINTDSINLVFFGYSNERESYAELYGLQTSFKIDNLIPEIDLDLSGHFTYTSGKEKLPGFGVIPKVRAQPDVIAQLSLSMKVFRRLFLQLENVWISETLSRRITSALAYEQNPQNFTLGSYNTLDMTFRLVISENFQVYTKFQNLFNKTYAGIDATGNLDDLFYNPQPTRSYRLGLIYNLD